MYENQSTTVVRQTPVTPTSSHSSLPTTPNFVRKFRSNFRPLDLRKITLYGRQSVSIEENNSVSSTSFSQSSSNSSQEASSPRQKKFVSASFHSNSHDSFMLKRQSSQNLRLRESLLSSLLSPRFAISTFVLTLFSTYVYLATSSIYPPLPVSVIISKKNEGDTGSAFSEPCYCDSQFTFYFSLRRV